VIALQPITLTFAVTWLAVIAILGAAAWHWWDAITGPVARFLFGDPGEPLGWDVELHIVELHRAARTPDEIAERLGLTSDAVEWIIGRYDDGDAA